MDERQDHGDVVKVPLFSAARERTGDFEIVERGLRPYGR